jgi:hypothetical protein
MQQEKKEKRGEEGKNLWSPVTFLKYKEMTF